MVENGLLFSPCLLAVFAVTFCGLLWIVLGSGFGHDRAKNDSGIVYLAQAVNRLCDCVYVVVGLRTVLGAGMGAWFA